MMQRRLSLLLGSLLLLHDAAGFMTRVPCQTQTKATKVIAELPNHTPFLFSPPPPAGHVSTAGSSLRMFSTSPAVRPPKRSPIHDAVVFLTAAFLALVVAMTSPLPLSDTGSLLHNSPTSISDKSSLLHHTSPTSSISGLHSSSQIILSKLTVEPLGGGGFGGLGIGPGFMPIPFGGVGAGFRIRNEPPPPTAEQLLDASQRELQAVKQYEKHLERQIQTITEQQQPSSTATKTTKQS